MFKWNRDYVLVPHEQQNVLFMKHLWPAGSCFNSLERRRTTKVRGLVGGGVLNVNLQTSAMCGW